jgi:hypothetical protein
MIKKNWLLIFVALVLAGVYVVYFTDWFKPKIIHITSTKLRINRINRFRNPRFFANASADSATIPVAFKFERSYKLTELKVVALDEWLTNKNCLPFWHLIADTNSVPSPLIFTYGKDIFGMKSYVPGARAEPLQAGVKYRLFVTDGSAKGEHDFQPVANPASTGP